MQDPSRLPAWPGPGLTRVPYEVYRDPALYEAEQERLFRGPAWHFLCMEAELPEPGSWRTTHVGETPVIVSRDRQGALHAFENRCAHRGALICLGEGGRGRRIQCVYHAWNYDLEGNLRGIAFEGGIDGAGGMPEGFDKARHGPRKLRVAAWCGLVFGTFSPDVAGLEDWLGPEIRARLARVLGKPVRLLGRHRQMLPNNWKLYVENVKDSYHASLLHSFFATFRLNRLTQEGGVEVDESGGHHVSWSRMQTDRPNEDYEKGGLRAWKDDYALADPRLIRGRDEFGDGVSLQILTVFPTFVSQQVQNALAVRQVVPKGVDRTELLWTYYGFEDDDPELAELRLLQANMVGPAGFISMEDGAVGGFVQRGAAGAAGLAGVVEMGGAGAESQRGRATETSVRGFWKAWRAVMGL